MIESAKTRLFGYATMVVLLMVSLSARKLNTRRLRSIPVTLILPMLLFPSVIVIMAMSFPYTNAVTDSERNVVEIDAKNTFRGADGEIKLMGVVHNTGDIPLEVKLGLDITTDTDNATETTVTEEATTYSRVLYPYSVSPFKFSIKSPDRESQTTLIGKPFINKYEKLSTPNYDALVTLNYTNIPSEENAALVGTVKNSGPFDLRNVTVYASAHDENRTQIDSVKSNVIPVIEPGQEMAFTAIPDLTIKSQIKYYSCAGVDMNPQMNKLAIGDNRGVRYDLEGPVAISDLKYESASDSMLFGVKHYNPDGGPMAIKVASNYDYSGSQNPLVIMLDGKDLFIENTTTKNDEKVLTMDIVVPPKEHEIQIRGISNLVS